MKRVVTGTLSAASVILGAGTVLQRVADAQDLPVQECSDVIIFSDGNPCTSDSCELIGETQDYCIYSCSRENICCW